MSVAFQYFEESLPRRPYHADNLAFGLCISGKGRALSARYIQQNQPHTQFWLAFNVDREGAAIDQSGWNAPVPNTTVKNPVNGHVHLPYALNITVGIAPDALVKASKYATAVEHSLCKKLYADVNYSGLICKSPFHLEWLVMEWREEAYTLDELADHFDLSASARRSINKHYGMGRNCHLFEMTREQAYRTTRQGWPEFSQQLDIVIQHVEMYDTPLPVPLSPAECRVIGRSIAGYTHRKLSPEGFSAVQTVHGRKGGIAKDEAYEDKRFMALCMLEDGYSQRVITTILNVYRNTIRNWAMHKQPYQVTAPFRWFFEQLSFRWSLLASLAMMRLFA